MAKSKIILVLNQVFKEKTHSLALEGKHLAKAYSEVTKAILLFAKSLHDLWEQAKRLDNGADNGAHRQFLLDELTEAIGTDSKTIRSRWLLIGQQYSELNPHRASLPPLRDNLYEVALATQGNKPISKWIEKGDLTPETSVREIRGLRGQKKKVATNKRVQNKSSKAFPATVTLCFESYEDALNILVPLLKSREEVRFVGEKTFKSALQELDDATYEKVIKKIQ